MLSLPERHRTGLSACGWRVTSAVRRTRDQRKGSLVAPGGSQPLWADGTGRLRARELHVLKGTSRNVASRLYRISTRSVSPDVPMGGREQATRKRGRAVN